MVGILNVTDDSFYDGGHFLGVDAALAQASRMVAEGAVMLDVGGQSTRPGHMEITPDLEIARVVPVIRALCVAFPVLPISIDTYKPAVAAAAFAAGAHVLNDIHGLQGADAVELRALVVHYDAAVIAMHHDATLLQAPTGENVFARVSEWLQKTRDFAHAAGLWPDHLVLDPGIGFGKTQLQNLALLRRLGDLHALGCPLLLGVSRKSVIGHVLPGLPPGERLEGTLALTALGVAQGVQLHRVHDVRANARAAAVAAAAAPTQH
jgi:dihydropteroate synthase